MPTNSSDKTAASVKAITAELDELKATDIVTFDIAGTNSFTDHVVICTANSLPHAKAVTGKLQTFLKEEGLEVNNKNRRDEMGGWNLIDAGDIIIHVFMEQERAYYRLEEIYSEGKNA